MEIDINVAALSFITFCAWLWFIDWLLALIAPRPNITVFVKVFALIIGLLALFGFLAL